MSGARRITIEFLGKDTSAGTTATAVEQKFGKLGGTMEKASGIAGKVLAVGLAAGGAALYKMGQAAAADEEAQAKLATQLRNAAGATDEQVASTESWITAQGKALGVADDELRPALSKLVAATHDVGKAQKLAALAMDIAAGSGKSLDSVSAKLAKGIASGSVTAFAQYGVATKNAKGEALSLDQVTKNLAKTYSGAAAKAADTTAGKTRIMQVQMAELGEQIGTLVLPVMQKFAAIGLQLSTWISEHTVLVGVLVGVVGGLVTAVWAIGAAMKAWIAITQAWQVLTKIATAVQLAFNAVMAANPIALVVLAIAALVAAIVIVATKTQFFQTVWSKVWDTVKSIIVGAIGFIRDHWKTIVAVLTGPLGLAVLAVIKNWDRIKSAISGAIDAVKNVVSNGFSAVKTSIGNVLESVKNVVGNIWSGINNVISTGISKVVQLVREAPGKILQLSDSFRKAGLHIIGAFIEGLKGVGGVIAGIAGTVWDALKGLINSAIDAINNALEFSVAIGPKTVDVNPPDIPHLAGGTRSFAGGMAVVGEYGPELVSLPRGSRVFPAGESARMGEDFTASAPLNVNIEGRTVVQAILTFKRRNGGVELGIA